MTKIKVGVSPINWSNDDFPILGRKNSLETILSDAQRAEFPGIEMGGLFPTDPESLTLCLQEYGLTLAAGWHSLFLLSRPLDDELSRFKDQVNFLKAAGSKRINVAECTYCPFKVYPIYALDQHYAALSKPLFPYQ